MTWETTTPEAAGIDQAVLDELATTAEAANSNCLLVARHGRIVEEWYWGDTTPQSAQGIASASKSVTSTLVGMASDDGDLAVTDPASDYIPEWRNTPSEAVTIENLLSNNSGRHWDYETDYVEMLLKAPDKTAFAIGLGQDAPPGEVWAYNNSAIQTLEAVFEAATGTDIATFAEERLFGPVGMADTTLTRDPSGNALVAGAVQSTCRDLARFGHLMAQGGNWNGEQVVSEEWVQAATSPSQDLNAAYGWLWWVNAYGTQEDDAIAVGDATDTEALGTGRMIPTAPEDMFFAQGFGGQVVAVDPGTDTVVVRLGPYTNEPPTFRSVNAATLAESLTENP